MGHLLVTDRRVIASNEDSLWTSAGADRPGLSTESLPASPRRSRVVDDRADRHTMTRSMPLDTARRHVMRRVAGGLLGVAAMAAGLVAWGLHRPGFTPVRGACSGGSTVKQKILMPYATRAGSTGEVAQAISERLCAQGFNAEVRPIETVTSLDGFRAAVLGSAIRYSAWLPEMTKFIESQRAALAALQVAVFTTHMQALDDSPASRDTRAAYTKTVRALITPRTEVFFAGKVDPATLSFFERMVVKMVKSPVGDRRDWGRIRAWADDLGARLQ